MDWSSCGGLHLLSCHGDHVLPDTRIKFHAHPYWELSFMLSGSMTTYCDACKIPCRAGEYELFLAPEGTVHRRLFGESAENSNLSYIFTLADRSFSKNLAELCLKCGYRFTVSGFAADLMGELRRKFAEKKVIAHQIMVPLAEAFLLEFLRNCGGPAEEEHHEQLFWNKLSNREKAEEIREFLLSHIDNPELNGRLSTTFKLSLRQLNRIFRQRWGHSISAALTAMKLEQSRILLQNTDMTVQEISQRMGFTSRMGFYNFFKKHNGMTPAEYRESGSVGEK